MADHTTCEVSEDGSGRCQWHAVYEDLRDLIIDLFDPGDDDVAEIAIMMDCLKKVHAALESGWNLSTWAAAINWDGSSNTMEWIEGLRERVEAVQEKSGYLFGEMERQ